MEKKIVLISSELLITIIYIETFSPKGVWKKAKEKCEKNLSCCQGFEPRATGFIVQLLKGQKRLNLEKSSVEAILVSKEAEFITEQHIQNPPKSTVGNWFYCYFSMPVFS